MILVLTMKIFIYFIVSPNERKLVYFKKSMKFLENLPSNFHRLFNASRLKSYQPLQKAMHREQCISITKKIE